MTLKLMINSGAYGNWQSGDVIAVEDYTSFLKRNGSIIHRYVNLDVIPGQMGRMDCSSDVEQSALQSYQNLQCMKDAGLSPTPVFHQGERFDWLEQMLEDRESYIGLSPYRKSGRSDTITWLDRCFATLKRHPQIKTHGFGVTSHLILKRYPWTSVDSGTWRIQPANGNIVVPIRSDKDYDYAVKPDIIPITDDQLHLPRHFDTFDELKMQFVRDYLREVIGIDLAAVRYSGQARLRCWAIYQQAFADWRGIDIVFATATGMAEQQLVLSECRVKNRLLSYYQLRDAEGALEKYIRNEASPASPRQKWSAQSWRDRWRARPYIEWRKLALYRRHSKDLCGE